MDLHLDAYSPTSIRRPVVEPRTNAIEGGGLPRSPALPSIWELADSSGANPNAVTRAIEDLKRSGYRPLHPRPAAPQPLSSPGVSACPARHGIDGEADSMRGSRNPSQEDES
jgi:DNA-binding transcriptional MocR family regulator